MKQTPLIATAGLLLGLSALAGCNGDGDSRVSMRHERDLNAMDREHPSYTYFDGSDYERGRDSGRSIAMRTTDDDTVIYRYDDPDRDRIVIRDDDAEDRVVLRDRDDDDMIVLRDDDDDAVVIRHDDDLDDADRDRVVITHDGDLRYRSAVRDSNMTYTYFDGTDFDRGPAMDEESGLTVVTDRDGGSTIYAYDEPQETPRTTTVRTTERDVNALIAGWPDVSQTAARDMIGKYGAPDGVTDTMLVWNDNGPWKCTIVFKEPVEHNFPMPHKDVLAQSIDYKVPADKFDDLAQYDGSVSAQRTAGCLTAMCDKEAMNFLALNLAHDIITGKRTVSEAREEYAKVASAFKSGDRPSVTQELQFEPASKNAAGDPDTAK